MSTTEMKNMVCKELRKTRINKVVSLQKKSFPRPFSQFMKTIQLTSQSFFYPILYRICTQNTSLSLYCLRLKILLDYSPLGVGTTTLGFPPAARTDLSLTLSPDPFKGIVRVISNDPHAKMTMSDSQWNP